jgi:N-acetyl-alpha-D-muramate 1-phosphate uridylyltransferase
MFPVAILAGGLATRLRPATETIPKALIEINGEPFLAHQLRLLNRSGIERAVLCIGHRGEQIQQYAGNGSRFGVHLDYSCDGSRLLGTAGALRQALTMLGDSFFVLYGDSYLPCDYQSVARTFLDSRKLGLMTVFHNEGQWDTSNVEFSGGRLFAYDKGSRTSRMRHIDYGLGVFQSAAFAALSDGQAYDLATLYQELLARDELAAHEVGERFYEIGSFAGIRELEGFLRNSTSTRPAR